MAGVRRVEDLDVYRLSQGACEVVRRILATSAIRRGSRLYEQLSDAAESACPNLAEGFARYYPREFARFVRIAKGSLAELTVHLHEVRAKNLADHDLCAEALMLADRASRAATRLIVYLSAAEAPHTPAPRKRPPRRGNPEPEREPEREP